jgi:hypothetical protein
VRGAWPRHGSSGWGEMQPAGGHGGAIGAAAKQGRGAAER